MTNSKRFGTQGVAPDLQHGKGGPRTIVSGDVLTNRSADNNTYARMKGADGVDAEDFATVGQLPSPTGGPSYLQLSTPAIDANVVGAWTFTWDPDAEDWDRTDKSGNGNTLSIVGTPRYTAVGNLDGIWVGDFGYLTSAVAPILQLAGDMTIEIVNSWDGSGSSGDFFIGMYEPGAAASGNALYLILNHRTGGIGMEWLTESGANVKDYVDFEYVEPSGEPHLLTYVRSGSTVHGYINGRRIQTGTQGTPPTGGANGFLHVGDNESLVEARVAGVYISNIARSHAQVLSRAQAAGFAQ